MATITLTEEQIRIADFVGKKRQDDAVRRGRPAKNKAPEDYYEALRIHVIGARCELAGKLCLDPVKWNALLDDVRGVPDLSTFIDVKGRRLRHHSLIVQYDDPGEWAYLLVCSSNHPEYDIAGWLWGREAKQEKNRKDPVGGRGAYFADGASLRSVDELKALVPPGEDASLPSIPPEVAREMEPRLKPPDLQEWVAKYGGYWKIPWNEWDAAVKRYQELRAK